MVGAGSAINQLAGAIIGLVAVFIQVKIKALYDLKLKLNGDQIPPYLTLNIYLLVKKTKTIFMHLMKVSRYPLSSYMMDSMSMDV